MPWPPPVVDNFTRADESPAVGWSSVPDGPDGVNYGGVKIVSNQLGTITGDGYPYYTGAQYGPDMRAYFVVATLFLTAPVELDFRLNPVGSSAVDGYVVRTVTATANFRVQRIDNNTNTTLGADITITFAAGDSVGVEMIGSTITPYYRSGAGAWAAQSTRSDATYNQAGYVGSYMTVTNGRYSEFGAETVLDLGWPGSESIGFPSKRRAPMPMIVGPREDQIMSMQGRMKG